MTIKPKYIKRLCDFIFSSKVIGITIFFITLIVLTALLSSRYYLVKNIIDNGISKKDVYATSTIQVIDTEQTEQKKQEMADKVESIYTPAQDAVNDYINNNFIQLSNSIKQIRSTKVNSETKKDQVKDLLGISEEDYRSDYPIGYMIKCSNTNYTKLIGESQKTLGKILDNGISEKDLLDQGQKVISENVDPALTRTQHQVIETVLKKVLVPNMVLDEIATDIAKKNAINSVKPIKETFLKGKKIVSQGELVTKLQKDALKKLGYNVSQLDFTGILGILCLVGICLYTMTYYLRNFEQKFLAPSYISLMSLLTISVSICAVFLPYNIPVYIIPFPAVAILLTIFTDSRVAIFSTLLMIISISVSLQYAVGPVTVFTLGAMVATFSASMINYYRRMDLLKAGLDVGLIQVLIILSIYLLQNNIDDINFLAMSTDVSLGLISGIASGIIALGTLPLIESAFKIITPYGLAELADHNQELLKRLQFEAPGTYHHSLMVSNLCEAAAEAVGANPVLAGVGAFYHDIGKLKRPLFFIENQSYFGIENPHEKLNPRLSKMVVTAHPKDGLELAKEYKLPTIIYQFITQHHGDSLAAYFYKQAIEEEGAENINEEQFRYNGPKPSSKETAILMLADAVESAVRSLKNPTQTEIEEMINKLIRERLLDGQLADSPLTQKDLKNIANAFSRVLRGMQHQRIKYHDNILEELGQRSNLNAQLNIAAKKLEKDFTENSEKNSQNGDKKEQNG